MEHKAAKEIGASFEWILTVIFIMLKVTGLTNMSWLWVFSPIWISAIIIVLSIIAIVIAKIVHNNIQKDKQLWNLMKAK